MPIQLTRADVSHIVIAVLIQTCHFSGITEQTKFKDDLGRDAQGVTALYWPIHDAFMALGLYLACGPDKFGGLKTVKDMVDLVFKNLKAPAPKAAKP
jgi:hypothetical protein